MARAKGYYGAASRTYKHAKEQVQHSLQYQYRDRRNKKREIRSLWITRINAAARLNGLSYSQFMHGLKLAGIELDRKVLSQMAYEDTESFNELAAIAKKALPEPLQQQSGAGSGNGFHAVQLPVAGKDGGGEGVADGGHDGRQDAAETAAGDANGGVVPSDSRLLVLIVDDNIEVRQYVASILHGEYDVILAGNGKEGLDIALKNVPDVIICDVLMPVMDGLEMCRRVKEATATSHVPVILLTSQAFAEQRAEGYDCGADAYITKPFSSKVLVSRVRNLLENRKRLKYVYGVVADNVQKECGRRGQPFHG